MPGKGAIEGLILFQIFLDKFLDILVEYTKESNFDPELLRFLANISLNY
jgi:hypothetical protein